MAFVYGSLARGAESAASDVDLMIVSDSRPYADRFGALEPAAIVLGGMVNPSGGTKKELAQRVKEGNAFVKRVLAQSNVWLIGDDHDLAL